MKVWAALIKLKTNYPAFRTANYAIDAAGYGKRINIWDPSMDVVVVGNFDVAQLDMHPNFPYTGTWYDYLTGDAFQVNNLGDWVNLQAGEWHVYTNQQLPVPDLDTTHPDIGPNYIPPVVEAPGGKILVTPNPFDHQTNIHFKTANTEKVKVEVMDLLGREVAVLSEKVFDAGSHVINWDGKNKAGQQMASGLYRVVVTSSEGQFSSEVLLSR